MFKIFQFSTAILIATFSFHANANANDNMYGIKYGSMYVSSDGASNAHNIGFVANIPLAQDNSSLEFEFSTSIDSGYVGDGLDFDWDLTTFAGYYTHRIHQENFYMKLKGGVLHEKLTFSDNSPFPIPDVTGDDTGLSLGFGIGWTLNNASTLEVEFTIVEEDINYLSIGLLF